MIPAGNGSPAAAAGGTAPGLRGPDQCGPNADIARIRARLMHGFGPGADPETIKALTRDRPVLAGQPTVVGLEQLEQQTLLARGPAGGKLIRLIRIGRSGTLLLGLAAGLAAELVEIARQRRRTP
ncbi:hypothetical protein IV500_00670 [Paeniglutamicibacter antarcticus]|uniref:Uncharacterized protein n=1 Tax=Arthrobacter terrae TaxID=2935737 RepID=A0A931G3P6_9MICC|nr:hypothetical protein [Arthrobacter terrae]MBG0737953.1 hypothetical protein [Arthrobacter terrae]